VGRSSKDLPLFQNSYLRSLRPWNCANELDLLVTWSRHNSCNVLRCLEIGFDDRWKPASLRVSRKIYYKVEVPTIAVDREENRGGL
jgi:Zn ribbon nucleic-acid-binding protein